MATKIPLQYKGEKCVDVNEFLNKLNNEEIRKIYLNNKSKIDSQILNRKDYKKYSLSYLYDILANDKSETLTHSSDKETKFTSTKTLKDVKKYLKSLNITVIDDFSNVSFGGSGEKILIHLWQNNNIIFYINLNEFSSEKLYKYKINNKTLQPLTYLHSGIEDNDFIVFQCKDFISNLLKKSYHKKSLLLNGIKDNKLTDCLWKSCINVYKNKNHDISFINDTNLESIFIKNFGEILVALYYLKNENIENLYIKFPKNQNYLLFDFILDNGTKKFISVKSLQSDGNKSSITGVFNFYLENTDLLNKIFNIKEDKNFIIDILKKYSNKNVNILQKVWLLCNSSNIFNDDIFIPELSKIDIDNFHNIDDEEYFNQLCIKYLQDMLINAYQKDNNIIEKVYTDFSNYFNIKQRTKYDDILNKFKENPYSLNFMPYIYLTSLVRGLNNNRQLLDLLLKMIKNIPGSQVYFSNKNDKFIFKEKTFKEINEINFETKSSGYIGKLDNNYLSFSIK